MKVFRLCIRNIRQLYANQRGLLSLLLSIQIIAVVIALDELEVGCRIRFESLPPAGRVKEILFSLQEQPSKQLTQKMLADMEELFPVKEVWEPESIDLMQLQYIFISYIVCGIVIFLVVYNIRMLFSYMLLQQKKEIEVITLAVKYRNLYYDFIVVSGIIDTWKI